MKRTSLITAAFALLAAACGANEGVLRSGRETPASSNIASPKTPIEADIEAMRTAGFTFIYVLRRKDAQPLDAEDVGVIRLQTAEANRRVKSDDDKAVVIGSNYAIPPKNMFVLFDRFAVENYSPPATPSNSNTATNAPK